MKRRTVAITLTFLAVLSHVPFLQSQERAKAPAKGGEEFFIISSIDTKKNQLVMKRPTEVTEVMGVTEKSVYFDEKGKALGFKDFRAGDTVYVVSSRKAEGSRVVTRIRKGPMTLEQLRRRYLTFH